MTADLKRLQQAESDLNSVKPPPAPNIMTEEKLVAAQKLVDAELSRIMQANADAQTHNARIDTLTNELNTLRMQLSTIDATLAKASLAPTNVLLAQIETAQAEIDAMVSLDEASAANRKAMVSTIDSLNLQLVKATKRQYVESQIKTLEGDLKIRVAKSEEVRSRHTAAVRLKGLSDLSATDAVAAILGAVNVNTKIYLDMLFPGEGTSVQILNTKENKNGTQAAKLSVKIIHKGAQFDSIDDLSGGESSRVQLAVQLAVGDLFNSPILLLDEAFAGVNGELRDECLMALRAVGEKRLVLVSEHNVQDGLFDDVIDFSK
jgi:DNA repair exonuclease SbcCD ATPase subunit